MDGLQFDLLHMMFHSLKMIKLSTDLHVRLDHRQMEGGYHEDIICLHSEKPEIPALHE